MHPRQLFCLHQGQQQHILPHLQSSWHTALGLETDTLTLRLQWVQYKGVLQALIKHNISLQIPKYQHPAPLHQNKKHANPPPVNLVVMIFMKPQQYKDLYSVRTSMEKNQISLYHCHNIYKIQS